jgi:hypothetical protein
VRSVSATWRYLVFSVVRSLGVCISQVCLLLKMLDALLGLFCDQREFMTLVPFAFTTRTLLVKSWPLTGSQLGAVVGVGGYTGLFLLCFLARC